MPDKTALTSLICASLSAREAELTERFSGSIEAVGTRFVEIDDLLPFEVADEISKAFPPLEEMRLMDSFRERKHTSKSFGKFASILADATFAFQDPSVIELISNITGISDQVPDSSLYAGGLSAMGRGHFLGPHIDNSHDASRRYYRTLNLLYYVSPDWSEKDGGSLQLWDQDVRKSVTIPSYFNRLVLMETTPWSWHSVSSVTCDNIRKCVSNYYFSRRSPTGDDYFNVTAFSAPPGRPFLRAWSRCDAKIRQLVRSFRPSGLGIDDLYDGPPR